jgi:hypothetical protein
MSYFKSNILPYITPYWLQFKSFFAANPRTRRASIAFGLILFIWLGSRSGCYRVPLIQGVSALEAIPYNTALILETPKPLDLLEKWRKLPYKSAFFELHLLQKWSSDVDSMQTMFAQTQTYQDILKNAKLVSGAEWGDIVHFNWLFVLEQNRKNFDIATFAKELKGYDISTRTYHKNTIYEIRRGANIDFVLAQHSGLILVSRRAHPVETGIEQIENIRTNVFFAPNFDDIYATMRHSDDINIYVGFKDLPILMGNLRPNIVQPISSLGASFDWGGFMLQTEENSINLSGSCLSDNNSDFWRTFSRQDVVDSSNISELLPDNTAISLYLGLANFRGFYSQYNQVSHPDFEEFILPSMKGEVLFFLTNPTSMDFSSNKFVALRLNDTLQAKRLLEKYAERYGELANENYQNFEIRRIAATDFLAPIFGDAILPLQNPYYVIINDFVVFCNSSTALQVWIEKFNFDKKLNRLPDCQFLTRSMARQNHLHIFIQPKYILPILQSCTAPEMHGFIALQWEALRNFSPITLQMRANGKNNFITNISLQYAQTEVVAIDSSQHNSKDNSINIAWQYDLKDPIRGQPQLIRNTDGTQLIAVQDTSDRLYLFSQNGELLWEYVLDLPILSRVYGLNYNNTGNLQIIFNTKNSIYFLDINGMEVQKIILPAPATTGVLLIDYAKGVRLLVGCDNGNIYGYDKAGIPLTGWNPKSKVGKLSHPMQLAKIKENYYVVGQFQGGRIGIFEFDAIGKSTFVTLAAPPVRTFGIDEQIERIAIGLQNGAIQIINFKGNTFALAADPKVNQNTQFVYTDVIGDSRRDYIRYSNGALIAHYYDEQNKYISAFQTTLADRPNDIFALLSSQNLYHSIGALHTGSGRIFLYDEKGQLLKGFPLPGTSRFLLADLVGDRSQSVIVANGLKLVVYKID